MFIARISYYISPSDNTNSYGQLNMNATHEVLCKTLADVSTTFEQFGKLAEMLQADFDMPTEDNVVTNGAAETLDVWNNLGYCLEGMRQASHMHDPLFLHTPNDSCDHWGMARIGTKKVVRNLYTDEVKIVEIELDDI